MELIRPWTTTIAKFNIADLVDLEEIGTAIVACCQQINGSYSAIRPEDPIAECLFNLRNDHITPKVLEYFKAEFEMSPKAEDFDIFSLATCITDGNDLESHIHAMSSVTTVMYPADSPCRLTLNDPRGAACRGYPREMVNGHFGNMHITPKAGDVYIIPSYVRHSVMTVKDEYRLTFVNDYLLVPN